MKPILLSALLLATSSAALEKPNIVLIYGDDVGFADCGVNGATLIPTPNIDSLASQGLNFTDAHSSASTCSPSRFSLLTGVHAFRHGVRILPPNAPLSIPTDILTLPNMLQASGYRTAIIGKWHLGLGKKGSALDWNGEIKPGPIEVGFESVFLLPSTNDRVPCVYMDGHRVINLDPDDPILVGNRLSEVQKPGHSQYPDARANPKAFYNSIINGIGRIGYMSGGKSALWDDHTMADLFVEKARTYISENREHPFFLFFASQDIHIPYAPAKRFHGRSKLGKRGDAMVNLDWTVGEIMKALDDNGLSENTILIFSSDNGPTQHNDHFGDGMEPAPRRLPKHDASGKWRGGKYEIFEGGTRVPLMIRWPARIKPGSSDATVGQIDFIASFAGLLGVELDDDQARDSRNILAAFTGEDAKGLPFLIEESHGLAIRSGDWKFIPQGHKSAPPACVVHEDSLFNLAEDPGEQKNLLKEYPEKAKQLRQLLEKVKNGAGCRSLP